MFSRNILLLLFICLFGASNSMAQDEGIGKLDVWTFKEVASRSKNEEVLPVSYKMRVSKNKYFDRIVFEFEETKVPE